MHDLYPVTLAQAGVGVLTARHDLKVQLNRQALAGQAQLIDQRAEGQGLVQLVGLLVL